MMPPAYVQFQEQNVAQPRPDPGQLRLYARSDHSLYVDDGFGGQSKLAGPGGGLVVGGALQVLSSVAVAGPAGSPGDLVVARSGNNGVIYFGSDGTKWLNGAGTGAFFFNGGYVGFQTDNTWDIGAVGANRPRWVYAATGVTSPLIMTPSGWARFAESNGGGNLVLVAASAAPGNMGAGFCQLYFRPGTTGGTVRLAARCGAAGAETTILDNIPT